MSKKKKKKRKLWIAVRVNHVPHGTTVKKVLGELRRSLRSESYTLPNNFDIELLWKNKKSAEWKHGAWPIEMRASAKSGTGWNKAVGLWLDRKMENAIHEKTGEEKVRPGIYRTGKIKPAPVGHRRRKTAHTKSKKSAKTRIIRPRGNRSRRRASKPKQGTLSRHGKTRKKVQRNNASRNATRMPKRSGKRIS
jgi:hypothetical protein